MDARVEPAHDVETAVQPDRKTLEHHETHSSGNRQVEPLPRRPRHGLANRAGEDAASAPPRARGSRRSLPSLVLLQRRLEQGTLSRSSSDEVGLRPLELSGNPLRAEAQPPGRVRYTVGRLRPLLQNRAGPNQSV